MSEIILNKENKIGEDIILVSKRLFKLYGYTKTTMEDIAKLTEKKESTLYYYYYKRKDEIKLAFLIT